MVQIETAPENDLVRSLTRYWWILLIGLVAGGLLALGALQIVPPTYSATATQLIKGVPGEGLGANYTAAQYAVARAKTYPAFINSSAVLEAVRGDMGPEYTDARLRDQLSAGNPIDTPLVTVTATGRTAKEAQDLANSASRHLARFITQIETVDGTTPIVVETAVQAGLPSQPAEPRPVIYIALGLTTGLAVAVIVVIVISYIQARRARAGVAAAYTDGYDPDGPASTGSAGDSAALEPGSEPARRRRSALVKQRPRQ